MFLAYEANICTNESQQRCTSHAEALVSSANLRDDDTHSDSGNPTMNGSNFHPSEAQNESWKSPQAPRASPPRCLTSPDREESLSSSPPESQSQSSLGKAEPNQAYVIEFLDDSSRKKRSQSFSNNASPPEPSGFRVQLEKTRKSSSPTGDRQVPSSTSTTPPTQRYTIPLKGSASEGFKRAGSLRREKTEDRISTSFSSRSTSSASARPFSSVGRRSKLAKEFTAEFLKQTKQPSSAGKEEDVSGTPSAAMAETGGATNQPRTSSPIRQPVPFHTPVMMPPTYSEEVKSPAIGSKTEEEDSLSDAGTYTIEADVPDKELEEERKKIDQASIKREVEWFDDRLYRSR